MNIYLVQHGKPVPKEEDPERPLSAQGKEDVEKIASKLNPDKKPLEKRGLSPNASKRNHDRGQGKYCVNY